MTAVYFVKGDLLDQPVEAIVNAWNRNIIPWWLLLPQGVSGAIKRRGGLAPFREVGRRGPIPLGGAVLTSAGKLPFRGIIHVAGINMFWRSSEVSIRNSVDNALQIATDENFASIAFPLIGAGSGGYRADRVQELMVDQMQQRDWSIPITIVEYQKSPPSTAN
ncbi:macro domain-containing protein [Blastopirellula sp. JC732]|uniref:Macro domain-containing protein n=1 Tax=Blastopirellula sediminis TaxID=2894196 RepID=A0A9X1SKV0_9BACT|nr:macro domain-containing protein [Blastopirellula sediminis]MCC9606568.1 macro domain-containing protein [Blastopirellula sediminis]MCC9630134.1 macro domain-containing protein [Blastopirellula sediminis]